MTKYADTSAHTLVGEFAIDINADNLKKEMSRDPTFTFSFWLVGQALDNTFNAVGNTFEEEVKPSVKVAPVVQVSNLKDIVIPDKNPVGGYYIGITDFCVYVSEAPREYTIKFTDQNTGGGDYFILKNSSSNSGSTLRYEMAFADSISDINYGGANYYEKATSLNNNRPYTGDANPTCLGGANHSGAVGVRVSKQNLDSAQDGFYTDTITVVVSPK
ncbi:MAG: hypothetical protein QS721_10225 [Candidatus Endonucleobacter sp. (ex Gigantidas childressi)]|nr:hypothetical protein [Candidatus Endonucleobacter sp. (ex Gigantidas childressi)]